MVVAKILLAENTLVERIDHQGERAIGFEI
jgi:hypothetical protein